jgi:hypothetical protein
MASRAFLVKQILLELGVYQSGQDLPPEDYRIVDESLEQHLQAMAKAHVYSVDDVDTYVPDEAVTEIARYLAGEYAQIFGIATEELANVMRNAGLAEGALRYQRTRGPTYVRQRGEYW